MKAYSATKTHSSCLEQAGQNPKMIVTQKLHFHTLLIKNTAVHTNYVTTNTRAKRRLATTFRRYDRMVIVFEKTFL